MFWTILALVMTVLMGGIIAYNGDLIGRKFGKRRTSLFGMRPKHTAILITSLTGVFISGITTGVLFLVVPPVKDVILYGEEALRMRGVLNSEIARLQTHVATLQAESRVSDERFQESQARLREAEGRLKAAQTGLAEAQTRVQAARNEAAHLTADNARLARVNTGLETKNRQIALRNGQLSDRNDDLSKQNWRLVQDNSLLARTNTTLKKDNASLQTLNATYQQQNDDIASQNTSLAHDNAELLSQRQRLAERNAQMMRDNDELTHSNERLAKANRDMQDENQRLIAFLKNNHDTYTKYHDLRTRRMVIHGGEDLARVTVPAGSAPDAIRKALDGLLREASENAIARGATVGDQARAVEIVDKQFPAMSPDGGVTPVTVTARDRINAVVNELAYRSQPYCVLALAVANSVEQEPAQVDLQPFPDRLVYAKGQEVALARLDGNRSMEQVFNDVVAFLKDLGQGAMQRGMIPRIDPATGEPQVGALGATDVVKVVGRIRNYGGKVRVRAIAAQDIAAAKPLELNFKIDPM